MPDDVMLTVDNLTVGTPDKAIVKGVSFTIQRGEILGVVGESGSGKTTLARAVAGLLSKAVSVRGGRIVIGGREAVWEGPGAVVRGRDVGLIFQNPMAMFNPVLPIRTQLVDGLMTHRELSQSAAAAEAQKMLGEVGLGDRAARILRSYPHQLSGGMLQRIAIAATLLPHPPLVVADEPTASLDAVNQFGILSLLARLKSRMQFSLMFISHDLAMVSNLCDRVLVLHEGQIVESGTAAEVFTAPQHAYTKQLLAAERELGLYREGAGHGTLES